MRWHTSVALLLVALPAFAQESEAEKMFRVMENVSKMLVWIDTKTQLPL